jgi:cobalt/nickel transport system permease protein/cobalt/nickel transport protein
MKINKLIINLVLLICLCLAFHVKAEEGKWDGVDAKVVEKYAKMYGREPKEPIINTDQGDLLLFVFTFFGALGGFIMGYNFRRVFKEQKDSDCVRT